MLLGIAIGVGFWCWKHKSKKSSNTTARSQSAVPAQTAAPHTLEPRAPPQAPAFTNLSYVQEQQQVAPPAYGDVFGGAKY